MTGVPTSGASTANARTARFASGRVPLPRPRDVWFRLPDPNPAATRYLYAFPHAGGGPNAYRSLLSGLPAPVEPRVVCLPGRENRWSEPPIDSMAVLVEHLLDAFRYEDLSRSVFFGHSMGARVAHQLCAALADAGRPGPRALIVSASAAPGATRPVPPASGLTDDWIVDFVRRLDPEAARALQNPELRELVLPTLRADLLVSGGALPHAQAVLDTPVHATGGRSDPLVSVTELAAWRDHTSAGFSLSVRAGGHFPGEGHLRALLARLSDTARS